MELITVIVRHAQDLEHAEHTQPLFPDTYTVEAPSNTLARIRSLLNKGTVSKTWQGAIMDPTLWTTFLNANLREAQFLQVLALSGDFPVSIWSKTLGAINAGEGLGTSHNVSDLALKAIRDNLPRVRKLVIDLAAARVESHKDANLQMLRLLTAPIPNLHTLSLTGPSRQFVDLTPIETSVPLFGGEATSVQHLELMNFVVPPCAFTHTLVSLSVGFNAIAKLMEVLPLWVDPIKQGDLPGLRELTIGGPALKKDTDRFISSWDHRQPKMNIPSTIARVKIVGSMLSCLYISDLLSIPTTVDLELRVTFDAEETDAVVRVRFLTSCLSDIWGDVTAKEACLTISPYSISFALSVTRSATLTFMTSCPAAYEPMADVVLRTLNPGYWGLDPHYLLDDVVSEETCLTLDFEISEADLQAKSGSSGSDIPSSIAQFLQSFKNVRNLHIKRYDLKGIGQSGKAYSWFIGVKVLESRKKGKEEAYPLPGLRSIRLSHARGGNSDELQRAVTIYAERRGLEVCFVDNV